MRQRRDTRVSRGTGLLIKTVKDSKRERDEEAGGSDPQGT